jgi:hypothetical protein
VGSGGGAAGEDPFEEDDGADGCPCPTYFGSGWGLSRRGHHAAAAAARRSGKRVSPATAMSLLRAYLQVQPGRLPFPSFPLTHPCAYP